MSDDKEQLEGMTLEDLKAVWCALDSWIDAFSDDDHFDDQVERVKKVWHRVGRVIDTAEREHRPYLRLVKPEDVN